MKPAPTAIPKAAAAMKIINRKPASALIRRNRAVSSSEAWGRILILARDTQAFRQQTANVNDPTACRDHPARATKGTFKEQVHNVGAVSNRDKCSLAASLVRLHHHGRSLRTCRAPLLA